MSVTRRYLFQPAHPGWTFGLGRDFWARPGIVELTEADAERVIASIPGQDGAPCLNLILVQTTEEQQDLPLPPPSPAKRRTRRSVG